MQNLQLIFEMLHLYHYNEILTVTKQLIRVETS